MLELPESYLLAKQMKEILNGKIISEIEVLHTPHRFAFFRGNPREYANLLEGKSIISASQHGGMVRIDTEDSMVVFTDGASLRYYETKDKYPKSHQMAIYFDDESALFMSVRMYAIVYVDLRDACKEDYYMHAFTKPDPLSEEFDYDYFVGLLPAGKKKISAKAFLATEQRIPGIGNGVLQDILWDAGIDPRCDMATVSEDELKCLFHSIKCILQKMCDEGGRDTESDLFGRKCGYISQLSKNSYLEPCIKCGNPIYKANYMGGTIYYCENCQRR